MKKLLIFAFLLFAKNVFAQKDTVGLNIPLVNNTVAYERVYDVPNSSQNLLYSNARVWFAGTHPDGGNTRITLKDSVLLRVAGKASYAINVPYKVLWNTQYYTSNYNFTVQIDCKDNKYRIRIYNIADGIASADEMVQSLIKSKLLTLGTGGVLSIKNLKQRLQILNNITGDLLSDVNKKMKDDNNF
jgi:hypothetical protein